MAKIDLKLICADVTKFKADVLVLKYAQGKYGVDRVISHDLNMHGIGLKKISPPVGHSVLVKNVGVSPFEMILFIGVKQIDEFGYQEIKTFSTQTLNTLKEQYPSVKHVAMTIHGVGYGLDESEAFLSQLAGLFEAIHTDDYPENLVTISIIEHNRDRFIRLQKVLDHYTNNQSLTKKDTKDKIYTLEVNKSLPRQKSARIDKILNAGEASKTKKHIFVAMPFKKEMYDTFFYGIQQPIHLNKFLCERIDEETFTGDILAKMKNKIETASAVIADLSSQNPNVYLEVGYAWGIGRPTILIIKKGDEVKFDVQGQKCLQYEGIKHLADLLNKEIKGLIKSGEIK